MKVLVIGSEGQLGSELKKNSKSFNKISWVFSIINDLDLSNLKMQDNGRIMKELKELQDGVKNVSSYPTTINTRVLLSFKIH